MSTQPDPDGCDLDHGEDVGGALFVSGCDAPEPLEPDRHHLMGTRPGARTSVVEHAISPAFARRVKRLRTVFHMP